VDGAPRRPEEFTVKVKDAVKAATDKYCELMDEKGFGCCSESYCWKTCGCEETEAIRAAIQQANQPDSGE